MCIRAKGYSVKALCYTEPCHVPAMLQAVQGRLLLLLVLPDYSFHPSILVTIDKLIASLQFLKEKIIATFRYPHKIHQCTRRMQLYNSSPKIDSSAHIPQDEVSAVNEESAREPLSAVGLPLPQENLLTFLRAALQAENQQANVKWPIRDQRSIFQFTTRYFSKAFLDILLDVKGDYTKFRLPANPTLADYFRHLMKLDHAHGFVTHNSFTFVCTNMLQRHAALTIINVFAKRCAQDLSVAELKRTLLERDEKVLNKLLYFTAPIPDKI